MRMKRSENGTADRRRNAERLEGWSHEEREGGSVGLNVK